MKSARGTRPFRRATSGSVAPPTEEVFTAVILAAGYGTRMGALGRERPKALLPVDGRPVLDHLVERLAAVAGIGRGILVTNHRFADQLCGWREDRKLPFPLELIDDGTRGPEERLGAVGDLALALDGLEPRGPVVVAGSDNVFAFPLEGLLGTLRSRPEADAVITLVDEEDPDRLRASGVARVARDGRVSAFREKPETPDSATLAPPLYAFREHILGDVGRYLDEGGDPDAPGHFLEWLVGRRHVHGWRAPGDRHDIGTPERYETTRRRLEDRGG